MTLQLKSRYNITMENVFYCVECDLEEVPQARRELGYDLCLTCGEKSAQKEVDRRRSQLAMPYPNGAYQYITGGKDAAKDFG